MQELLKTPGQALIAKLLMMVGNGKMLLLSILLMLPAHLKLGSLELIY
jgi:hypothetical protein